MATQFSLGRRMEPGIVVLDTSVLKYLATDDGARSARASARVAHVRIWPSMINVLEAMNDGNVTRREKILRILKEWLDDRFLLPWPPQLLRSAGLAARSGKGEFSLPSDELFTLRDQPDLSDESHIEARAFFSNLEGIFKEAHDGSGPELRRIIKARGLRDQLQDAQLFIEDIWGNDENLSHQSQLIWSALAIDGEAPTDIWRISEPWQVMLDALGAAVFFRSVRLQAQGNPAGLSDLLQFCYLTAHTRSRILVTDDKSMRETAAAVMTGRYPNVRVVSGLDFFTA
jgi:hypothetical protein